MKNKLLKQNIFYTLFVIWSMCQIATVFLFSSQAFASSIHNNQVDILGQLPIKIKKTSYDKQWKSVKDINLSMGAWSDLVKANKNLAVFAKIKSVNKWVNSKIQFKDNVNREWLSADKAIENGFGSYEEIAIAKMQLLAKLGVDRNSMYLVLTKNLTNNQKQAVLVVKNLGSLWVLDSFTDIASMDGDPNYYRPVFAFSSSAKYTFDYRAKNNTKVGSLAKFRFTNHTLETHIKNSLAFNNRQ